MNKMKLFIGMLAWGFLLGCTAENSSSVVKVVNWNVQTFFDANTEGTEYSDFISQKYWGVRSYETRLDRLCEVVKALNADIFVFEEIENQDVVYDISNTLANYSWAQRKNWKYAAFSKNTGDSIGCAVFSRYEISDVTVHSLDIRTETDLQPKMRPIMKMKIHIDGKTLTVFVNHWKSKSGGAEKSEAWRDWQERLLARLMKKSVENGEYVLASGDFNRDISEFTIDNPACYENVLLDDMLAVHSPWIYATGDFSFPGSYYYQGEWNRIDHFLASSNVLLLDFQAECGFWSNSDGTPHRYAVYNGTGYSDHLPISAILQFQ